MKCFTHEDENCPRPGCRMPADVDPPHKRIAAHKEEMRRASAELRHAYRVKQDWNLVARAIALLEVGVEKL